MAGTSRGTMKKKKAPQTQAFWLAPLLFFLALDVILALIFGSFERNAKLNQDLDQHEEAGELLWDSPEPSWSITCDRSHFEYDLCYVNHPAVYNPNTTTLTSVDPTNTTPPLVEKIRPYPRKWQHNAMETVKEVTLTTSPPSPPCDVTHTSPALLFSAGGFTSNVFHDFCEGFIPLYVTVLTYFKHRDVVLAIVDTHDWWVKKYGDLIQRFTHHPIINLDKETETHCFPSAIVGLMSHGPMLVDPTLQRGPHPKTTLDFHDVLISTYNKSYEMIRGSNPKPTRPRLVLMSRTSRRVILNQDEVVRAAMEMGFDVTTFEPTLTTPVEEVFRVIHSSHVMIGVHGAGLTNELFLRSGSVFVQIVPLRNNWLGDICYGKLAIRLGLEYFTYDITAEESSMFGKYPDDMLTPMDKGKMLMSGFDGWAVYMEQNVTLNLDRFKRYLERAYLKAKIVMEKENMR